MTRIAKCSACDKPVELEITGIDWIDRLGVSCDECIRAQGVRLKEQAVNARRLALTGLIESKDLDPAAETAGLHKSSIELELLNGACYAEARRLSGYEIMTLHHWVTGGVGTGKTYFALCLMLKLYEQLDDSRIRSLDGKAFTRQAKRYMNKDEQNYIGGLTSPTQLLIDDIDKGDWDDESVGELWSLINARSGQGKGTIFTSNGSPKQVKDQMLQKCHKTNIVEAVFDRMRPLQIYKFKGETLREQTMGEARIIGG